MPSARVGKVPVCIFRGAFDTFSAHLWQSASGSAAKLRDRRVPPPATATFACKTQEPSGGLFLLTP